MKNVHLHLLAKLENGTNPHLQCSAIAELGVEYLNTGDSTLMETLARLVKKDTESIEIRKLAYVNLFMVSKRPTQAYPAIKDISFPDNIDWQFVNGCLNQTPGRLA